MPASRHIFLQLSLVMAGVVLITGCGGGGGSDSASATPALAPAPTPAATVPVPVAPPAVSAVKADPENASLVVAALDANYVAGIEEATTFQLLNQERSRCGFGKLTQNAALDKAALAHASWVNQNALVSHIETKGTPGFTGEQVFDRVVAAGYANTTIDMAHEEGTVESGNAVAKTGVGTRGMRRLLSGPYHANGLLGSSRDVGVAAVLSDVGTTKWAGLWLKLSSTVNAGPQLIAGTDVVTYPCDGTTGTAFALTNETPNPVPGRDLLAKPLGQPVMVRLRDGHQLTIASARMTEVATGVEIPMRPPITSANDPTSPCRVGCFQSNEGYVIPDVSLKATTAYRVAISGTNDGKAFSRTFTFTTGVSSNP